MHKWKILFYIIALVFIMFTLIYKNFSLHFENGEKPILKVHLSCQICYTFNIHIPSIMRYGEDNTYLLPDQIYKFFFFFGISKLKRKSFISILSSTLNISPLNSFSYSFTFITDIEWKWLSVCVYSWYVGKSGQNYLFISILRCIKKKTSITIIWYFNTE